MNSPRKGKALISLRVRKIGTSKRFTTRLFVKESDLSTDIIDRLRAKYPGIVLGINWTQFRILRGTMIHDS
uniref:Uncharacterized protein n=1 Tax=Ochrobactrum phage ORM_20 TaxID=2985243 RepID=A0A9N6WZM4_9VIRU|nr:hypothetical protein ORM20_00221 [Ochrobactrum phage ORM_20]